MARSLGWLVVVVCALVCAGCHSWVYAAPDEITTLRTNGPVRARITTEDGPHVLDDARIDANAIVGIPLGKPPVGAEVLGEMVRVELSHVSTLEVIKSDDSKTAELVVVIVVGAAAAVGLAVLLVALMFSNAHF